MYIENSSANIARVLNMPKTPIEEFVPPDCKSSLGITPAALAKRELIKPGPWCPKSDIEFDAWCDPNNPRTVTYKDSVKAASMIKEVIPRTPLRRSKCCVQFKMEMYFKFESFHRTGSFHERGALYSLLMLNEEQRMNGVISASLGNWAMALAYQGRRLKVQVTVVLPVNTCVGVVENCQDFGASIVLSGNNLAEAKRKAFDTIAGGSSSTYINGYDHPHVIAGSGSIGIEIMEQLPQTDAILIPVGGGGLIAGIATVVKHLKPEVLIYGIESDKCCSFFKAMENERPYKTEIGHSLARSLAVPTAGYNAFHTAKSLVDKMVLVDDDWIVRAILNLVEEEKVVAEGAGATSLGAMLALPNVLPELRGKSVVCLITGGNIDQFTLSRCLNRGKVVEGRIIKLTVTLPGERTSEQLKIFSIIANVGCNVIQSSVEHAWLTENKFQTIYLTITCETRDLEHACTLKRVMERIFPNMCVFAEEPFGPIPICSCFPKKRL